MVDPGVINAIANLGATGLLVIAIWALVTDRVITKGRLEAEVAAAKVPHTTCEQQRAKLEAKLDAGAGVVERQADALQGQIDALKQLVAVLREAEGAKR